MRLQKVLAPVLKMSRTSDGEVKGRVDDAVVGADDDGSNDIDAPGGSVGEGEGEGEVEGEAENEDEGEDEAEGCDLPPCSGRRSRKSGRSSSRSRSR